MFVQAEANAAQIKKLEDEVTEAKNQISYTSQVKNDGKTTLNNFAMPLKAVFVRYRKKKRSKSAAELRLEKAERALDRARKELTVEVAACQLATKNNLSGRKFGVQTANSNNLSDLTDTVVGHKNNAAREINTNKRAVPRIGLVKNTKRVLTGDEPASAPPAK